MDNEEYERLASIFLSETGIMAPSKDVAAAMGPYNADDIRRRFWEYWLNQQ